MVFENEIIFPSEFILNVTNRWILRELSKTDLTKLDKPVYVLWQAFDTFEFPTLLFEETRHGVITVKHRPKREKIGVNEWSYYYDRYIKDNPDRLDMYHRYMNSLKRSLQGHIDRFYNPYHALDDNLCIIKTVKDLFDLNGVTNYRFVKPSKKKYWKNKSDNDFFENIVPDNFNMNEVMEAHELYHVTQGPHWMEFDSFFGKYEYEIMFLTAKEGNNTK